MGRVLGSDASTLGSVFLCLLGRYEHEANRRATLENEFVVLKKVSANQSILKEISPEYSLEGLMLKLKLHYLAT